MKTILLSAFRLFLWLVLLAATGLAATNDNFNQAITIDADRGSVTGDNFFATKQNGEVLPPAAGGASVWWRWIPNTGGTKVISLLGSNFNTVLAVYTGSSVDTLALVASNDDVGGGFTASELSFTATADVTYYISVDGFSSQPGTIPAAQGNYTLSVGPSNDPGIIVYAPIGFDEANSAHSITLIRALGANGSASVLAGATSGGEDTATGAADFLSNPTPVSFGAGQRTSSVSVTILQDAISEPDETFRIGFSTPTGATVLSPLVGPFPQITIFDDERPANDDFANASPIMGGSGLTLVTTQGASTEAEPAYKPLRHHSVWYLWVAPENGVVFWSPTNQIDLTARLYTGNTLGTLVEVPDGGVFVEGGRTQSAYPVIQGTTYHVLVDAMGTDATASNEQLNWIISQPGKVQFTSDTYTAFEPAGTVRIPLVRTGGSEGELGYLIDSQAGTATVGNGNGFDTNGVFMTDSLADSETGKDYFAAITDNDGAENPETFTVTLHATPVPLPVGTPSVATVTIVNNDNFADAFALSGASGSIEAGLATATVEAGEPAHGPSSNTPQKRTVWFAWTAPDGNPVVFRMNPTLANGQSFADFSVYTGSALNALTRVVGSEFTINGLGGECRAAFAPVAGTTYYIALRNSALADTLGTLFTLQWKPAGKLTFNPVLYTVPELGGHQTITIMRAGDTSEAITVRAVPHTGSAGVNDFDVSPHTVSFTAGAASATFDVDIFDDNIHEAPEFFTIGLEHATGNGYIGILGGVGGAVVTIVSEEPFTPHAGKYNAVFGLYADPLSIGMTSTKVTATGQFTGTLNYGGKKFSLKGQLDINGAATLNLKGPNGPFTLTLQSTADSQRLLFTLADGPMTSNGGGDLLPFDPKDNLAPAMGTFTAAAFASNTVDGRGFVTFNVAASGAVKILGQLADGTPFSAAAALGVAPETSLDEPHFPLFVLLYKKTGYVRGDITLNLSNDRQIDAQLDWLKGAAPKDKFYPAGLSEILTLRGAAYLPPAPGHRVVDVGYPGFFSLDVGGGGVTAESGNCYLLANNTFNTFSMLAPKVKLTVAPKTGILTAVVTSTAAKPVPLPGKGIVVQIPGELGLHGYFLNAATKTSGFFDGEF